jgi:hypothetical protein
MVLARSVDSSIRIQFAVAIELNPTYDGPIGCMKHSKMVIPRFEVSVYSPPMLCALKALRVSKLNER